MKIHRFKFWGIIVVISFLLLGCNNVFKSGHTEGIIHYDLTYLQSEEENPIISLLPTEMDLIFKNDYTHQKVEGWMGIFYMGGIYDVDKDTKTALLKIMGKKYQYSQPGNVEVDFGFDPYDGMKIEPTNEVKEIAGVKCNKYHISFPDKNNDFDIYTTNDIKIKNANWNNPYHSLKGVMVDYQIKMFGIDTRITAKSIEFVEVSDDEFVIPDGFESVSKEDMEEVINNLM